MRFCPDHAGELTTLPRTHSQLGGDTPAPLGASILPPSAFDFGALPPNIFIQNRAWSVRSVSYTAVRRY